MEKGKLTDNIGLKIMSVLVGFLVWLIVGNMDNPITTTAFTIPASSVEVVNEAYVDSTGKMCMLDENQQQIRVTITGEKKKVRKISSSDLVAEADLQQAVSLDTDPVMIPIVVTCDGISAGNIEVTPKNLTVHLREKKTQEFVVSVTSGDSKPGKGYEIGTLSASPEKIRITGPSSLINKIASVSTTVNVEGKTTDMTVDAPLTITDKNGDTFTDAQMKYLNAVSTVSVTAKFWKVNSAVRIEADYSGVPAEGYYVDSVTTVPNVISVAGSDEGLALLQEQNNQIGIPPEYIDIEGQSNDLEEKVSITELLPSGVKLASGSSEDVWVRINILPVGSNSYDLSTTEVEVKNLPKDLQVAFDTDKIEIRIQEDGAKIEALSEADIQASIDLSDMEEGSYEVPVEILLPDGYSLVEDVTADIRLMAVSVPDSNED